MMGYYLVNTIVAMVVGLTISNVVQPGAGMNLNAMRGGPKRLIHLLIETTSTKKLPPPKTVSDIVIELVPNSIGDAFAKNNLAQLVLLFETR